MVASGDTMSWREFRGAMYPPFLVFTILAAIVLFGALIFAIVTDRSGPDACAVRGGVSVQVRNYPKYSAPSICIRADAIIPVP